MTNQRRAFLAAIPGLVATSALAADKHYLPSKVYEFQDMPVHHGKTNTTHSVLNGLTHEGCRLTIHESDLAPGNRPHPPHHHAHEEMFFIRQGTLGFTINGKKSKAGPGSVAFVASNDEHGVQNVGDDHAQYFVMALYRPGSKD